MAPAAAMWMVEGAEKGRLLGKENLADSPQVSIQNAYSSLFFPSLLIAGPCS